VPKRSSLQWEERSSLNAPDQPSRWIRKVDAGDQARARQTARAAPIAKAKSAPPQKVASSVGSPPLRRRQEPNACMAAPVATGARTRPSRGSRSADVKSGPV